MRTHLARASAVAVAALTAACTTTETEERQTVVYEPYEGPEAYANRRPQCPMPEGDLGVTSDSGSDTITLIDLEEGSILCQAPVGRDPVDIDGPHHVGLSRELGFAVVALSYPAPAIAAGPHAGHGSSTRSGFVQKLALDDLRALGEVRIDANPGEIVLSEDGSRIAVSHFDLKKALDPKNLTLDAKRANVIAVDPETLTPIESPEPTRVKTCIAPHGMALSRPDGATAYVACYGEDALAIVSLDDPKRDITYVPVGPGAGPPGSPAYGPYAAAMNRAGSRIAVSNTESRDVRLFDVATQAFVDGFVVSTFGQPYFAAFSRDDATLYIPAQSPDEVLVVDGETGLPRAQRLLSDEDCVAPHETALSTDGTKLYVLCEGDRKGPGTVLVLDPDTLDVTSTYTVGVYPDRLLVVPAP
jgi:DNA-binding beta-propeller fold protein YncE